MPISSLRRGLRGLALAALLAFPLHRAPAQITRLDGQWSLFLSFDYNYPTASSMRGNGDELRLDIIGDPTYTTARYPFGDSSTTGYGWGGNIAYRFHDIPVSVLAGLNTVTFVSSDTSGQRARLAVETFSLSGEYSLGGPGDFWNTFVRAGVTASDIHGDIRYVDTAHVPLPTIPPLIVVLPVDVRTEVPNQFRFGIDVGLGARVNIPTLPISVEGTVDYINANLVGRSYIRAERTTTGLPERALNDGPDPDNGNDPGRTIDMLSLRIGLRTWF
jgi:hypothetical protein